MDPAMSKAMEAGKLHSLTQSLRELESVEVRRDIYTRARTYVRDHQLAHLTRVQELLDEAQAIQTRYDGLVVEFEAAKKALQDEGAVRQARNDALTAELRAAKQALRDERENGQARNAELVLELQAAKKALREDDYRSEDDFVLVLIDGNGYMFQEELLEKGADGGKEASKRLCEEVRAYYEPKLGNGFKIVVQVFLDSQGLASTWQMSRVELQEFYEGFNAGREFFDYYDIGVGTGLTQMKLMERYFLHKSQRQCRSIMLGCSNDGDYLSQLPSSEEEGLRKSKLCILDALEPASGFSSLPFPHVRFDNIFRTSMIGRPTRQEPGIRTLSVLEEEASDSDDIANAVKKALASFVLLNAEGQRVDENLGQTKSPSLDERRAKKELFCHEHFLGAGCPSTKCRYGRSHDRMSSEELNALRSLVRSNFKCSRPSDCRSAVCYMGHQCPRGSRCRVANCKFFDLHDKDVTPASSVRAE